MVVLKSRGYTYKDIQNRLQEEGIEITIKSLYLLVTKYSHTNSITDRPRQHRRRLLDTRHYTFIDNALITNDELTTRQLHALLIQRFPEVSVSHSTLKRAKYELGWVITNPKYCQLIRDANKEKRLAWCEKMIADEERFQDVIFTDESSVMLETHRKKCYRKRGTLRKLKA